VRYVPAVATKKPKKLGRSLLAEEVTVAELKKLTKPFKTAKHYIHDELTTYVYDSVVVDGDLSIKGDFNTFEHNLCRLVVTGSLKVSGLYLDFDDPQTAVFVLGDFEAKRVITTGALCVAKNVIVHDELVGFYNDHCAEIRGNVKCNVFAPENHFFTIGGKLSAKYVLGEGTEYLVSPKLKASAKPTPASKLQGIVVPEIVKFDDDEDGLQADWDQSELRKRVRAGKSILKPAKKKKR
jgi:hypothetical protein